ncbi:MAG: 30S ribosomal protein S4 [Firmicutes bacterium]|uniref:Small ribosomal subunit protein uS4 n=1 Tax=Candidatus Colimorpha enterica TaxID=3083063 RepID=R6TZV4_9BACT|nr:30S ribosomal protein S4 [Candidatus Colimorpha enterica]MCI5756435.1 30S ribosomal protein S4 [Candidatus Colimorpha enterica]MDD6322173.1 30S ribosomal protein S4 [Bacillota bacterium]MDY2907316.1 30S ribosomal protein S4 [Eubacteriales bacterium]CDC73401.1 30S ribosomal protein S4 [Candidatus Colimorpha enterica]
MARYTGSVCRLCRREGTKLFLKGDRCLSGKCALEKRPNVPGQHGAGRKNVKEYGLQLREKQKAKRYYGVLESQFKGYFEKADKTEGVTGENLLSLLERRLDNVVYRIGLADSRKEARQFVTHGHFRLNGKKVTIPSLIVRAGDVITLREESRSSEKFKNLIEALDTRITPKWIELDKAQVVAKVAALPARDDVDFPFEEHLIVELYSK